MPDPRSPSITKPISVPLFAITWHTSPSLLPGHVYACSGGGGSAKTGVNNFIEVVVQSPKGGEKKIKIDTGDDVGVALDAFSFVSDDQQEKKNVTILLALGIQDSVAIYRILVDDDERSIDVGVGTNTNEDVDLGGGNDPSVDMVGTLNLGEGFLTNTVAFDALGCRIAAGGENGSICVCKILWDGTDSITMQKENELNGHHIKGICKVTFHPRNPNILLSSAKDGTCRVWDFSKPPENQCLDTLDCKIYDPKDIEKKKEIPKKILNPAPGQCLVKSCIFADLQGQYIFTVQSGRRGKSFLSIWRVTPIPVDEENIDQQSPQQQPPKLRIVFREQARIHVADFPVSAVSLSGDYSTLVLGDTNGSVKLINTETFKTIKYWDCIHDLPVTCLAARPLPMPLAGEDKIGIAVDAICSSADSKMCFLTKQRKSTLKRVRKSGGGGLGWPFGLFLTLMFVFILLWMILFTKISFDICSPEYDDGFASFGDCVVHAIWWAPQDRPGIASIPI